MNMPNKIGRYEILEELGHGAMGTVYRAKDPAMDRVVALKTIISLVLASEQGSEFRERFYREARAAGALAHPGIVPVFDVGEHEGLPFLVMEFISGRTLADAMKNGERFTQDRICEIGQKIAEALGYAHQRGVVHRDIKPANILLTSKEAHGIERPKITDFGVAKLAAGHTTLTGQILGTPAFMPPEQFTGAPIDGRADVFSLGVVLYWMATGEQPFPGESLTAVSYKVVHTDPVPPRKLNPSIPAKLDSVITKCLAKSPDDRYQTGDELARDLGNLRVDSTAGSVQSTAAPRPPAGSDWDATLVEATPTGRTKSTRVPQSQKAARWTRNWSNNRFLLAAAAAVGVAVIAGGWYLLRHTGRPTVQVPAETAATASATSTATQTALAPASQSSAEQARATRNRRAATASRTVAASAKSAPRTPKRRSGTVTSLNGGRSENLASPARTPGLATVGFNPASLDPKKNSRLEIEADKMPPHLGFTIEMNGKVYLRQSAKTTQSNLDHLYVPPGVQAFRVMARSGAVQKISNTVSTEFKAKKRYTLRIELQTRGAHQNSGVPQGLYPDTEIVLILQQHHFF